MGSHPAHLTPASSQTGSYGFPSKPSASGEAFPYLCPACGKISRDTI